MLQPRAGRSWKQKDLYEPSMYVMSVCLSFVGEDTIYISRISPKSKGMLPLYGKLMLVCKAVMCWQFLLSCPIAK